MIATIGMWGKIWRAFLVVFTSGLAFLLTVELVGLICKATNSALSMPAYMTWSVVGAGLVFVITEARFARKLFLTRPSRIALGSGMAAVLVVMLALLIQRLCSFTITHVGP